MKATPKKVKTIPIVGKFMVSIFFFFEKGKQWSKYIEAFE